MRRGQEHLVANVATSVPAWIYTSGVRCAGTVNVVRINISAPPMTIFTDGHSSRSWARYAPNQPVGSTILSLSHTLNYKQFFHSFPVIVIKIKALASQSVLVEWVPPNVATDLATDYMEKLGADNVPVTGSKAATKRKQQLEFQVPPHDLDANLCDNLSESESQQLQQYVQKLREHCVGQGSVVRVGNYGQGILTRMPPPEPDIYPHPPPPPEVEDKVLRCLQSELTEPIISSSIEQDAVLSEIVAHPKIAQAILQPVPYSYPKIFMVFREPFIEVDHREKNELMMSTTGGDRSFDDPDIKSLIRPQMIEHLHGFNKAVIRSAVIHGPIYDRIFEILKVNNKFITYPVFLSNIY